MKNKYFVYQKNKETIEPEEILLDSMSEEARKMEDPFNEDSIRKIEKIFFAALSILLLQVFYLQVIKGNYYTEISQKNHTRTIVIKSPRGIIYDRNKRQIVFNVPVFDLVVIPSDFFRDKSGVEERIEKLAKAAGISKDSLEKKMKEATERYPSQQQPLPILENISKEKALLIEEKIKGIEGVRLESNAIRKYIDGIYFAHIIGYSGRISKEELEVHPDYSLTDTIGKSGLEFFYEKQLRGKNGKQEVEVDSFGREIRTVKKKEPEPGYDLILNVDSDLQKKIYEEIKKTVERTKGASGAAAVALNPNNGAVLALVSYPSYDNNLFAKGLSTSEYSKLLSDKANPLFNRVISGEYPPGSTIKPLIGAAALQEKIISPTKKILDRGVINVGSYRFLDWKAHGMVDLIKAIAQSCNVYFYTVGGGYGGIKGLGIENIKKYAHLFGLGKPLGIDIPGERSGLVPDKEWKKKVKSEQWYIGDTYHVSIGQGDILVTPLQIAAYTSAIANGGKLFQPQIVDKIVDSQTGTVKEISPKIIRENFIDPKNLRWIQRGMRENVISGAGRVLNDLPVKIAGKTGTAQYAENKKAHAWYTSYAPYDNPEIVLTVIIEGGGEGHKTAVPLVKEVFKWYFKDKDH